MSFTVFKVACIATYFLSMLQLAPTIASICGKDEFTCGDQSCIPKSWKCDYEKDCPDGEDESDDSCDNCESVGYICRSTGKCIPPQWKCDNWTDCLNQDDEKFCSECSADQFKCNDGECIDASKRCDYVSDCFNGEDEVGCKFDSCLSDVANRFLCDNNKTCISKSRLCDGTADCRDKTDECTCTYNDNVFLNNCFDYSNLTSDAENEITSTLDLSKFEDDNEAPKWKYCPSEFTWLGFLPFNQTSKDFEKSVKVYFIEPKLRLFNCDAKEKSGCNDYEVIPENSESRSGSSYALGKHSINFIGKKTKGDDEATICTVQILVLAGIKNSKLSECKNLSHSIDRNTEWWKFTVNSNSFLIADDNTKSEFNPDVESARYYSSSSRENDCYARIWFKDLGPKETTALESAFSWMVKHVWPIVGIVVATVFLICGLIVCVVVLLRRLSEYKQYQEAQELELSDEEMGSEAEEILIPNQLLTTQGANNANQMGYTTQNSLMQQQQVPQMNVMTNPKQSLQQQQFMLKNQHSRSMSLKQLPSYATTNPPPNEMPNSHSRRRSVLGLPVEDIKNSEKEDGFLNDEWNGSKLR